MIRNFLCNLYIVALVIATCYLPNSMAASQCEPEFNAIIEQMLSWRSTSTDDKGEHCLLVYAEEQDILASSLLVDLRPSLVSEKSQIKNSINYPGDSLVNQSALKNSKLVLFDNGYKQAQTEALCIKLQHAGFNKVTVLSGGINALVSHDRSYLSQPDALASLFELSFEDITYMLINKKLVVYAAYSKQDGNDYILSRVAKKNSIDEIERILSGNTATKQQSTPILIVGNGSENLALISRFMPYISPNVYFFSPGIEAYENLFTNWQKMLSEKKIDLSKIDRCMFQ